MENEIDDWSSVSSNDFHPVDTGYSARVEAYRPEAAVRSMQEGVIAPDVIPDVPIVTPLMKRGIAYAGAAMGAGEGDTTSERYANTLAMDQALSEERAKTDPYSANVKAANEIVMGVAAAPELGFEKLIAGTAPKTAPYVAPVIEGSIYGTLGGASEINPGDTAEDIEKKIGLGGVYGAAAPLAVKGVIKGAGKTYSFLKPTVQTLFDPEGGALTRIAQAGEGAATAKPSVRGLTPEGFAQRVLAGEDVNIADIHGVKPLLEGAAATSEGDPRVAQLNDNLTKRLKDSGAQFGEGIDTLYYPKGDGKINAGIAREDALKTARKVNGPAYELAYSKPIDYASEQGQNIENLINNQVPAAAVKDANDLMRLEGVPQSKQIMAKIADDGTVTYENKPDVMQVDYITRALNDIAKKQENAGAMGGITQKGAAYQNLAKNLRDILRGAVPEYGAAVDGAGRYIRQNNAFDAGQDFVQLITKPKANPQEVADQINLLTRTDGKQYTPEEKTAFSTGIASFLKENPEVASKLFSQGDTQVMNRLRAGLGSDVLFNGIDDLTSAQRIAAMTREIGAKKQGVSIPTAMGTGAAISTGVGELIHNLPSIFQHITDNPTLSGVLALGGASAGLGIKKGMNAMAQRRADALLSLAVSDQKQAAQRLLDITSSSPQNRAMLHDIEERIARYTAGQFGSNDERIGRKSGGRVNHIDQKVNKLIRESARIKNLLADETERMLSLPDDTIAHALSLAKKVI